jgi:precorrin-3B methylase
MNKAKGSVVIVGTGIQTKSQMTPDAIFEVQDADKVLFLVSDPVSVLTIKKLNNTAESLASCYEEGKKHRFFAYESMIKKILSFVRKGLKVCVVFYGHPGVFVYPSHEVIKRARKEGYEGKMLPGISAEDCLFADLGVDPSRRGCQSFEATDFLVYKRRFEPSSNLILWQIGVVGEVGFNENNNYSSNGMAVLCSYLKNYYDIDHPVVIYEAPVYRLQKPHIDCLKLKDLGSAKTTLMSTLYIPPKESQPDQEMLSCLNMKLSDIQITMPCWQQ